MFSFHICFLTERFAYEVKTYETFETTEEIEEIVEDYEVSEVVAQEKVLVEDERIVSTHQSITSSHDDTLVRNVSEQVLIKKGAEVDAAELSRTQYETLTRVDSTSSAAGSSALFGGASAILGGAAAVGAIQHGGASSTTVVEETKKAVFDCKYTVAFCCCCIFCIPTSNLHILTLSALVIFSVFFSLKPPCPPRSGY